MCGGSSSRRPQSRVDTLRRVDLWCADIPSASATLDLVTAGSQIERCVLRERVTEL